jgi:hypothetical protein
MCGDFTARWWAWGTGRIMRPLSLSVDRSVIWWYYWKVVETRRSSLVGREHAIEGFILSPDPFSQSLYLLSTMNWASSPHHMVFATKFCLTMHRPRSKAARDHGLKPQKLCSKINPSSLKLFCSGILSRQQKVSNTEI